jgi:hypothetical protein
VLRDINGTHPVKAAEMVVDGAPGDVIGAVTPPPFIGARWSRSLRPLRQQVARMRVYYNTASGMLKVRASGSYLVNGRSTSVDVPARPASAAASAAVSPATPWPITMRLADFDYIRPDEHGCPRRT